MSAIIRQIAITTWQFFRGFWMILGISLAMFLLLDSCFRVKDVALDTLRTGVNRVRYGKPARPFADHPVLQEPWWPEFFREFNESGPQAWRQWVYFRRDKPYKGRYVNIDSQQHRVVPQPRTPVTPTGRVFLFGGSTMWGSFQRDDNTIAAEVARRLQTIAPAGGRYEVTNLSETGHVFTQGMLELMLQLREGQRPDVVLFFDGINDGFSVIQNGKAGVGQNEQTRINEFTFGRRITWNGHPEGILKDWHSYGVLGSMALERTEVVRWLRNAIRPPGQRPLISTDSAVHAAARIYAENVRIIEALSRTYGFTPVYVWQPTLHATQKKLTPFERRLMGSIKSDSLQNRLRQVHLALLPVLDSTITPLVPGRFVNEGRMFRGDSLPVYTDRVGHNTEASVPSIVDGFWPALKAVVEERAKHATAVTKTASARQSLILLRPGAGALSAAVTR